MVAVVVAVLLLWLQSCGCNRAVAIVLLQSCGCNRAVAIVQLQSCSCGHCHCGCCCCRIVMVVVAIAHSLGMAPLACTVPPSPPNLQSTVYRAASGKAKASDLIAVNGNFPCTEQCKQVTIVCFYLI